MLKLTDFGFAKETTQNALQTPCYTPYYVGESSGMASPPFPHRTLPWRGAPVGCRSQRVKAR